MAAQCLLLDASAPTAANPLKSACAQLGKRGQVNPAEGNLRQVDAFQMAGVRTSILEKTSHPILRTDGRRCIYSVESKEPLWAATTIYVCARKENYVCFI